MNFDIHLFNVSGVKWVNKRRIKIMKMISNKSRLDKDVKIDVFINALIAFSII